MRSLGLLLLMVFVLAGPSAGVAVQADTPSVAKWYKGNLHTHTTLSDGDSAPEKVIAWYLENDYDFLAVTDHNVIMPLEPYQDLVGKKMLLISANEVSDKFASASVHILALGLTDTTLQPAGGNSLVAVLQNNIDAINGTGALPIVAHPNHRWSFTDQEMLQVKNYTLFEVLNAHPRVNNFGGGGHISTEEIWDRILSAGRVMYGIGTDDMHKLATYPGKSWIMVKADELSEKAIFAALKKGDFYVSTGVLLEEYIVTPEFMRLKLPVVGLTRYTTRFIGQNGRVLKTDLSSEPRYFFSGEETYIRVKVIDSNGLLLLTQPYFRWKKQ